MIVPALLRLLRNPAFILLISANVVNAGNLLFNLLFSRWTGPELFAGLALILTIKLSLLSALTAVQMVIAKRVSEAPVHLQMSVDFQIAKSANRILFATGFVLPVVLGVLVFGFSSKTNGTAGNLAILFMALPFMVPLMLERGRAQGVMNLKQIIWSAQLEMLVRLVGGALAWHAGFGVEGIVVAIALSLIAGWYGARLGREKPPLHALPSLMEPVIGYDGAPLNLTKGLIVAALPWALLQGAQITAMDADIIAANIFLSNTDAGILAAANIIQRIQFFAVFVFGSLLVPIVVNGVRGGHLAKSLMPVGALFIAVNLAALIPMAIAPDLVANLMFGDKYTDMGETVLPAGLSAFGFSAVYLTATILMAMNRMRIAALVFGCALVQIGLFSALAASGTQLVDLIHVKAAFNLAVGMAMVAVMVRSVRTYGTP